MPAKKDDKEITVEAELCVYWEQRSQIIRTFDKAWRLALTLPKPVRIEFMGFVRKEDV